MNKDAVSSVSRTYGAKKGTKNGGRTQNRTGDTGIFSPLLYRLSYPATCKLYNRHRRRRFVKPSRRNKTEKWRFQPQRPFEKPLGAVYFYRNTDSINNKLRQGGVSPVSPELRIIPFQNISAVNRRFPGKRFFRWVSDDGRRAWRPGAFPRSSGSRCR